MTCLPFNLCFPELKDLGGDRSLLVDTKIRASDKLCLFIPGIHKAFSVFRYVVRNHSIDLLIFVGFEF